jgi:hypothetical protein
MLDASPLDRQSRKCIQPNFDKEHLEKCTCGIMLAELRVLEALNVVFTSAFLFSLYLPGLNDSMEYVGHSFNSRLYLT